MKMSMSEQAKDFWGTAAVAAFTSVVLWGIMSSGGCETQPVASTAPTATASSVPTATVVSDLRWPNGNGTIVYRFEDGGQRYYLATNTQGGVSIVPATVVTATGDPSPTPPEPPVAEVSAEDFPADAADVVDAPEPRESQVVSPLFVGASELQVLVDALLRDNPDLGDFYKRPVDDQKLKAHALAIHLEEYPDLAPLMEAAVADDLITYGESAVIRQIIDERRAADNRAEEVKLMRELAEQARAAGEKLAELPQRED